MFTHCQKQIRPAQGCVRLVRIEEKNRVPDFSGKRVLSKMKEKRKALLGGSVL